MLDGPGRPALAAATRGENDSTHRGRLSGGGMEMVGSLVSDRVETLIPAASRASDVSADASAGAYSAFVEAHLEEAYRLATFILGDRNDAEDAVHEGAVLAWRHWPDRRDPARSEAWFRRIVVNASRDRLRARRRIREIGVGLSLDPGLDPAAAALDATVAARDEVARALRRLDADARTLLGLRFGLDLSVPAIAATLGIREGTVKSRLHRALRDMQASLEEERR